jgi:hypothetical protein
MAVADGQVVTFRCSDIGKYKLNGAGNVTCQVGILSGRRHDTPKAPLDTTTVCTDALKTKYVFHGVSNYTEKEGGGGPRTPTRHLEFES